VTTHGIALHFLWAFAVRGGTQTHPESQAWHLIIIFSISQKIFLDTYQIISPTAAKEFVYLVLYCVPPGA
jgi:hypothetical protein